MTEPTRNDEVVYGTSHSKSDHTLLDSEIENKIGYILKKYSVYCFMGERASDFDEVKAEQAFKNLLLEARYDELLWSTGVEYKYDKDRETIQNRLAQLQEMLNHG